ncbi:hypothetical protein MRX96_037410 [Rhipicephalus microplus]
MIQIQLLFLLSLICFRILFSARAFLAHTISNCSKSSHWWAYTEHCLTGCVKWRRPVGEWRPHYFPAPTATLRPPSQHHYHHCHSTDRARGYGKRCVVCHSDEGGDPWCTDLLRNVSKNNAPPSSATASQSLDWSRNEEEEHNGADVAKPEVAAYRHLGPEARKVCGTLMFAPIMEGDTTRLANSPPLNGSRCLFSWARTMQRLLLHYALLFYIFNWHSPDEDKERMPTPLEVRVRRDTRDVVLVAFFDYRCCFFLVQLENAAEDFGMEDTKLRAF